MQKFASNSGEKAHIAISRQRAILTMRARTVFSSMRRILVVDDRISVVVLYEQVHGALKDDVVRGVRFQHLVRLQAHEEGLLAQTALARKRA